MAKEALFNILQNQYCLESANVLDLFSGTGNLSYEFVSRGCEKVTAVDQNIKCIRFIQSVKEDLKMDNLEVVQANCFAFLEQTWQKYDIIFADPPYNMPEFEKIVNLVFERGLLNKEGVLIIEHSRDTELSQFKQHFRTRNYGSVHFSFFENLEE